MSALSLLLKESWSLVEEQADEVANYFFARVFLIDPQLRDLFPTEMADQRRELVEALVTVVHTVDDPERFDVYLRRFGRTHRRLPVTPEHYAIVGGALLDALRLFAGVRWSIEYDQAWRDMYDAMAVKVIQGAAIDATEPAYCHAEVIAHERLGPDLALLSLRPLKRVDYLAGQYVHLESQHLPEHWRPYSIANAPRRDGTLDFHIRTRSSGWVSAALVRRTRVGEIIRVGPPTGTMTLASTLRGNGQRPGCLADPARDLVLIAGGTGLAPIKALLEQLAHTNRSRWVHLFYGAREPVGLYGLRWLRRLAGHLPWLTLTPACSHDPNFAGEFGPIHEVVERKGPWTDHEFFVSGPPAMVRSCLGTLSRLRTPHPRVHYDPIPGPGLG